MTISLSAPISVDPYASLNSSVVSQAAESDVPSTSQAGGASNVDAVSQDFEAVFISQMLNGMFEGDELTSYFGGGTAGEVYKSFLTNEYGKVLAKSGGIGIAAQVKKELLKLQEIQEKKAA